MDFVSLSSELLTSQRLPESSLTTQKRLLDEMEQEKGRWEQYMFYCLSVQDDILKNTPHLRLSESSLGSSPSDFKRLSDLVAEAQNKVTVALRRKREDSGLNSKVWEAFTSLTQRIYEAFFRAPESRKNQDDDAIKRLEEEAERLRGRMRDLELQLVEASGQLKSKDLELESIQRTSNSRSSQFATSLEGELQRTRDRSMALEAENERLKIDLEASGRRFNQSASFKNMKRDLDRKAANIDEYLTQARPLAMSDLELSRLKNEYEMALHEVQQLREWKRRRENDEEAREEGMGNRGRVVRRQREEEDDGKVLLSREREKSAGFFSQLQKKEKEIADMQKSTSMQRAELEHLRGLEEEYQAKLHRQQEEVAKFLGLIKALEDDKERAYALVQQHYQDKLKAERDAASLRIQFSSAANSEEVVKQLRLAIEEKQKLARGSTESKAQAARLTEEIAVLKAEISTASRERDTAISETGRLQERLKSLEKASAVTKEWKLRQAQDRRAVQEFVGEARAGLEQQYTETLSRLEEAESRVGELEDALERCKEQTRDQTGRQDGRVDQLRAELSQTLNRCADLEAALKQKQEEAASLSALSKKLKSERDSLQQDLKRKDDKIEFLSTSQRSRDKQIREAQALLTTLEQERDQAVQQAQELNRDNKSMEQALDSLEELRESVARAEEESATFKLSLSHMTQAKAAAEGEIKALKANISDLQEEIREKDAALTTIEDRYRSQIAESDAKWRAAEKKSASGRERQASLESKLEDFTAKKESLTEQLHQSVINAEAYSKEIAEMKGQLAALKGEKADMSQSIGELRNSLAQATSEATKKERLINELRTGTEGEKRAKEQLEWELQDLHQQLTRTKDQLAVKTEDYAQLESESSQNSEEISRLKDQLSAVVTKAEAGKVKKMKRSGERQKTG
jgi:chromosome segregation ATPase